MSKEVTLVIITYNSEHIIEKCLEQITNSDFDLIVVDNNSSDNTVDLVVNKFPEIKIIKLSRNSGYGRSANIGIKFAKTPYVMILNPDLITNANDIKKIIEQSKSFNKAIITAPNLEKDNSTSEYKKVNWVCGAAMLINKDLLINNIGYFDENIFLFYEETDLCKRIIDKGFEIIKFNNIYMNHIGGISSKNTYKKRYCKSWNAGWSDFYYHKKHMKEEEFSEYTKRKLNEYISKWKYNEKDPEQETRNKAFYEGAIDFLTGIKAFDDNGNPIVLPE
jgi:GT2 family glycosyltransferase